MFKTTQTWPNLTFGQLFMLMETNSDSNTLGPSNKDQPFYQLKEVVL